MNRGWRLGSGDLLDRRYRIEEVLGSGASGRVYAAFDEAAGDDDPERVAVKIIGKTGVDSRSALELEFTLLARMSHPNLVDALGIGVVDGRSFLIEELVEGPTLEQARPELAVEDYWLLAHQILEGLDHIHRRGWVHHDIKPANILLSPGAPWTAKIADLGVASLSGSDPAGRVSGTVPFLSPERLVGRLADPRSDIWALGMTLLYCITGCLVIDTDSVPEAARLLRTRRLPALRDLCPEAPAGLEVVIARMLSRDGRTRYRDGGEALVALRSEMERARIAAPILPVESVAQSPAFVGRDAVLAAVLDTLGRGDQRRPRVVRIRGPQGSGRSRLLSEVALEVQLRGARAVFVPPGEGLTPWRAALTRLGGDPVAGDPDAVVDRMVELLEARPAVLLVDDVDAAGSVSRHVLDRLGPALASVAPGFLCGAVIAQLEPSTWRPAEPSWFVDVYLEALGSAELEALTRSVLGGAVSTTARAALERGAGGNPSRLLEAIRQAVGAGALRKVAGVWELEAAALPAIDDLGGDLLADLDEDGLELLLALTVLGPSGEPVPLPVIRQVADLSWVHFSGAVASLRHRGLIQLAGTEGRQAGMLALSMGAAGRAALACTADDEIRRRHQRAWMVLQRSGDPSPAQLARHALGAGLRDAAVTLTGSAIGAALARGDYAAVLELTDTALPESAALKVARAEALVALSRPLEGAALAEAILERDPDNAAAAVVIARAALMSGDARRAARGLARLQELAATARERVEIAALSVEVDRLGRTPAEVAERAREQLAIIDGHDVEPIELDRARARILLAAGTALVYGGAVSEGLAMLEPAHALFVALDDHAHIAHVEGSLAAAADLAGRDDDRRRHLERGLQSAARAGADSAAAPLLNIRGLDHLWRGRTSDAVEALEEAERRGRRAGLYKVVSAVTGNLVVVYRRAGLYGRALSAARRSRRVKGALGDAAGLTVTLLNLADLYHEIGDDRLAVAAARRGAREAREQGRLRFVIGARATLALALAHQGFLDQARAELDWIAAHGAGLDHHALLEMELARAALDVEHRNLVDAAERLRDIAAEAERRDEPYFRAWACYERGVLLGDVGVEDLRTAVEVAASCAARHHLWRARAQLGLVLSAAGHGDQAGAELARAREVLVEIVDDLPHRHRRTYVSAADRRPLVAAIRAEARFPEAVTGDPSEAIDVPTLLDAPGTVSRSSGRE